MSRVHVLLLAGGSGTRMGSPVNKVLLPVAGKTCILRSAEAFIGWADDMVIVCRPEDEVLIRAEFESRLLPFPVRYVSGGTTRQDSVFHGLSLLKDCPMDPVLVHDGARCLVNGDVIARVLDSVLKRGSGVASVPVTDTIRPIEADELAGKVIPREALRAMQTPQGFRAGELWRAHLAAREKGFQGTDDAAVMAFAGFHVFLTEGSRQNLKLTTKEDLAMARAMLEETSFSPLRVGMGYDVHAFADERNLILCGVEIPYSRGLLGHSDADVAVHALMDALLGAAGLGDIGRHFPDSDPVYKGISSMKLLESVLSLLRSNGFCPTNADITIVAQEPKLAPYISEMNRVIASALALPQGRVNVKATTTEHLGFEGRKEGISAQAICLIQEIPSESLS